MRGAIAEPRRSAGVERGEGREFARGGGGKRGRGLGRGRGMGLAAGLWRGARGLAGYSGGLALFGGGVALALAFGRGGAGVASRRRLATDQLGWMLGAGVGIAALAHLGLGGVLAMQAYYGAIFVEATAPVVMAGLTRNVAPLLSGLALSGLLAARMGFEPMAARGAVLDPRGYRRWVGCRALAAGLTGSAMGLAGLAAGSASGAMMARRYLGIGLDRFFDQGWTMIWTRDVIGLGLKGLLYGATAAVIAGYEVERAGRSGRDAGGGTAMRAALIGGLAVLGMNSAWFVLMYKAGPAFGPTVLPPPVVAP